MSDSDCLLVLTTLPADADAAGFARQLVEERLAACVAVQPEMESVYRWEGQIEEARERQLVIKTSAARRDELIARMTALHPYDVPEVLVLHAGASEAYGRWIGEQTLESREN